MFGQTPENKPEMKHLTPPPDVPVPYLLPRRLQRQFTRQGDFFEAVKSNNVAQIKYVLQQLLKQALPGTDPLQTVNAEGESGLIVAARANAEVSLRFLLSEGAVVDARDYLGRTALHWAVINNHLAIVECLLTYHASIECKDGDGHTPAVLAKAHGFHDIILRFRDIVHYNYHAEQLALHKNVMALTDGEDIISEVACHLQSYLGTAELDAHRNALEKLCKELLQPEDLLCAETSGTGTDSPKRLGRPNFVKKKSEKEVKQDKMERSEKSDKKVFREKGDKLDRRATVEKNFSYSEISKEDFAVLFLTVNSSLFRRINALINAIDQFNQSLSGAMSKPLDEVSGLLRKAKQCYLRFQVEVCQAKGPRRIELCAGRARVRGFLGFRYLNAGATLRFAPFFNPEEIGTGPRKDNAFGSHAVLQLWDTHYKIRPTAPGVEQAFHSLNTLISGQGSAPTELLVFEKGQSAFPVLASKSVSGENFADVLEQHPDWVEKLDAFNYTAHVVLTLLTCPSDVKPDNYMAVIEQEGKEVRRIKLIGIDNDLAFDPPYMLASPKIMPPAVRHSVDLKAVFFCMPQIEGALDAGFRQAFLKQSPTLILLKWLKDLLLQEERYLRYRKMPGVVTEDIQNAHYIRSIFTEEEFKKIRVPLKFLPGTLQAVYERMQHIQGLMKRHPKMTHALLLQEIYPALSACYAHARAKETDIFQRIQYLYMGFPYIGAVPSLSVEAKQELDAYGRTLTQVEQGRSESLLEAAAHFINTLDYTAIDLYTQGYLLEKIGADFSFLKALAFTRCAALTDERLGVLAQSMNVLESLTLVECTSLDGSGLSAVLSRHPEVRIVLDGFASMSVQNLLSLLQHSRDLVLMLEGNLYQLNQAGMNGKLLKQALTQDAYSSLVTALLLSGAHLGFGRGFQSPLHLALEAGKETVVRELVRYGASLNELNHEGKSPLDVAFEGFREAEDAQKKQCYQGLIFLLVSQSALETKQAASILQSIQELPDTLFSAAALGPMFTFVCCHNLLTTEWIQRLVPTDTMHLDLSPKTYSLAAVTLTEDLLEAIYEHLPQLETLTIQGCKGLSTALFYKLLAWKLTGIVMDFAQAQQCGLAELDEIEQSTSLITNGVSIRISQLILSGQTFTPALLLKLGAFIRKNVHLKILDLICCHLSANDMKSFAGALGQTTCLERLNLTRNPLGDEGISLLLSTIEKNKHNRLRELCLDETGAGVESATVLGRLLAEHAFLESVSLYKNPLGDAGVEALARGLEARSQTKLEEVLKRLTLNEVGMSEAGAYRLSRALFFLKALIFLDVGYNALKDAGAEWFVPLLELNRWLVEFKYGGIGASERVQGLLEARISKNREHGQRADLQALGLTAHSFGQQRVTSILPPEYFEIENLQAQNASLRQQLQAMPRKTSLPGPLPETVATAIPERVTPSPLTKNQPAEMSASQNSPSLATPPSWRMAPGTSPPNRSGFFASVDAPPLTPATAETSFQSRMRGAISPPVSPQMPGAGGRR